MLFSGRGGNIIRGSRAYICSEGVRGNWSREGGYLVLTTAPAQGHYSMNGEVRIWDVRAPDVPLYETVAQPHGLMALAVHTGAPVFAT